MVLELFTRPGCPYCPPAMRIVEAVIGKYQDSVEYKKWDTTTSEGAQAAAQYGIQTVPTIILGRTKGFVGVPNPEKLEKFIRAEIEGKNVD